MTWSHILLYSVWTVKVETVRMKCGLREFAIQQVLDIHPSSVLEEVDINKKGYSPKALRKR